MYCQFKPVQPITQPPTLLAGWEGSLGTCTRNNLCTIWTSLPWRCFKEVQKSCTRGHCWLGQAQLWKLNLSDFNFHHFKLTWKTGFPNFISKNSFLEWHKNWWKVDYSLKTWKKNLISFHFISLDQLVTKKQIANSKQQMSVEALG